jgi:hypothetical protein
MPAIPEGWATLIATFIGLVAVYVQYKLRTRNTSILLANALITEITTTYERQTFEIRQNRTAIENKVKEGTEKFTTWSAGTSYAIYDNASPAIFLLPENALKEVVSFYKFDSWLCNTILNMGSDTFFTLSIPLKQEYIKEIYDTIDNAYTTYRDRSVEELQKITKKTRLPW